MHAWKLGGVSWQLADGQTPSISLCWQLIPTSLIPFVLQGTRWRSILRTFVWDFPSGPTTCMSRLNPLYITRFLPSPSASGSNQVQHQEWAPPSHIRCQARPMKWYSLSGETTPWSCSSMTRYRKRVQIVALQLIQHLADLSGCGQIL